MKGIQTAAGLALGALLLAACSTSRHVTEAERKEAMRRTPPPLHLGAVHQVFPEKHFALLRIIGPLPADGTVLITHPPDGATDRIGNLCVSSAQNTRSNIIAADIRSGTVIKGDRVFLYRSVLQENGDEPQENEEKPAEEGTAAADGNAAATAAGALPVPPTPELPEPAALPRPNLQDPATETPPDTAPQSVETSVLPTPKAPTTPSTPATPAPEQQDPSSLKLIQDVPDNIHGWE